MRRNLTDSRGSNTNRLRVLAFVVLVLCLASAAAADKYDVPPHPKSDNMQKCAVAFDDGYPKNTGDAKAWKIERKLKYNYDTAWEFKELEVYYQRVDAATGQTTKGASQTVTNESDIAPPGSYAVTFSNVAPPAAGENIQAVARIKIKKAGEVDRQNSVNAIVPLPPPPPGGD